MMQSPLRYPGGKSDFLATAIKVFRGGGFEGAEVFEPYAGSAAVSLGLLDFGLCSKVTLLERDPLLYAFWSCVFERPAELIVRFQDLDISVKTWTALQPMLALDAPDDRRLLDMGLAGLFFNRANFSGILNGGPIGGKTQSSPYKIDCRTNKDDIAARVLALAMLANQVEVKFGDAIDLLESESRNSDAFFYLDPPYFNKGELLYRYSYGLRQHKQLASALAGVDFNWLLSYDQHHVIEFLYEDFFQVRRPFRYSVHSPKNHRELLISNFPLSIEEESTVMERRQRHWPRVRPEQDSDDRGFQAA